MDARGRGRPAGETYAGDMWRGDEGRPIEVVLVEDDGDRGPVDRAGAAGAVARPPARRSRRVALAAALAAVLVGLLAVDAASARRERAALAAHADVPGVVSSLAEPLSEAWRLQRTDQLWALGGAVLTVDDRDGLVGLDPADGRRRWSAPLPAGATSLWAQCLYDGVTPDGRAAVACVVPRGPDPGPPEPGAPIAGVDLGIDVLDAADGRVVASVPLPPRVTQLEAVGSHVDWVETTDDAVVIVRDDVVPGDEQWRAPLGDLEVPGLSVLHPTGDVVALEGPTTVVVDAEDGSELGRWAAASDGVEPAAARVLGHPGTGFGVWGSQFSGRWYAPDGTPGPALEGAPVEPPVDDASTPGVVLLQSVDADVVRAVDVTTGDELWSRPQLGRVLMRLGGRVVQTGDGRMEALDVATGERLWQVTLDEGEDPNLGDPYTDGVRLVVRGEAADGNLRLTAYDLADGDQVWRAPLPEGSEYVLVLGDRLAAVGRPEGSRAEMVMFLGGGGPVHP